MIKVGVIGLGTMGTTHLDVYARRNDVKVVGISDTRPDRLAGKGRLGGNVAGQAQGGFDFNSARHFHDGVMLINDPEVDLIDICLPTPMHIPYAKTVLQAGKHLLLEKPVGRRSGEIAELVALAEKSPGYSMVAQCMRFWPGWVWLKEAVADKRFGNVLAAHFRRVAEHPGGAFYSDGEQSGGAVLDMHVHDTDFIQFCFGMPEGVTSVGYSKITTELDHLVTQYHYPHIPMVMAEGGWAMAPGFGFRMQYTINFERATASFDFDRDPKLLLWEEGKPERAIELQPGMGYEYEIAYMLNCIRDQKRPSVITVRDAARSIDIVEAEIRSAASGRREAVASKL